jgi:spore maturation protein SpmA
MLNYIWLTLIAIAVLMGSYHSSIGEPHTIADVGQAAIDRAIYAVVPLAATLLAMMTLWLGLMRLAEKAGLVHRLGQALRPILRWLFPEVPADHPALGAIVLNVSANILGLGNAATPLGLRAMSELDKLNPRPGVATNAMCMLLAINTSSITLIPVTAIAFLAAAKGKNPTVIIGTSLAATAITQACAIGTCKLLERMRWSKRQLEGAAFSPDAVVAPKQSAVEGADIETKAVEADATLPWVPGAKWVLAVFFGIFIAMVMAFAFPETIGRAPSPDLAVQVWPLRLVSALSGLVLPWLILLFPLYAALRRIPVYEQFVEGGKEAVHVILRILPYLVGMLAAVGMFSAAGGMEAITWILRPVTDLFHFPAELVPMAVIRPFSNAAAQGLLTDLIKNPSLGPDNIITLMAATFYGCSETTFYVIAVYFGAVGIRKTRHAIPTGLIADTIAPIAAVIVCRAILG